MININGEPNVNKEAIEQIIRGMTYMVNDTVNNNMTKVYDGIVISNNNDGRWNIKYNGETHPVKPYGPIAPNVNAIVKVIVPQGNQALSWFFIPGSDTGGGGGNDGVTFIPSVSEDGIISWTNNGGLPNPTPVDIMGPQGAQGQIGPQGIQGDRGETGYYYTPLVDDNGNLSWTNNGGLVNPSTMNIKGPQGAQGIQGIQGPQGETGAQGPQGLQGDPGYYFTPSVSDTGDLSWTNNGNLENPTTVNIKGPQGAQGVQGIQGEQGPQGIQGVQGPEGPEGPQGPQGETGPYFTPSVDSNGDLSWSNNGGLINPSTVNIKGPQGEQGTIGPVGPQGEQGETGYYFTPSVDSNGNLSWANNGGLQNPSTINIKGPVGPQGSQGEVGPQGPQGIQGETGQTGPQGETGPQGAQGEKGADGFSPIATVTQTETGATISIQDATGTTTANITNGQNGAQGPQGPQGDVGPQGPAGEQGPQGATGPAGPAGENGANGADATINGVNALTIEATGGLTGTQSGNTYSISGENLPYLKTTGGTLTGNLTGKYLTGTWLQSTAVYELNSSNFKGVCVFDGSGWVYYRTKEHFLADIGAVTQEYVDSAVANAGGVKKFNGTLGPNSWTISNGDYQYQAQVNISDMTAESVPNAYPQWTNQSVESIEWNKLSAIESFNGYVQFYATSPFSVSIDYVIEY